MNSNDYLDNTTPNLTDQQIFEGKTLSQLLKEIYTESKRKTLTIDGFIDKVEKAIESNPKTIGFLMPFIKDFIEASVANDDQLIKIANIATKIIVKDGNKGDDSFLSEQDKKELLEAYERSLEKHNGKS